jgi:hypothetical protein
MFWKCTEDLIYLVHGPRIAHSEISVAGEIGDQGEGGGGEEKVIEKVRICTTM